MTENEGTEARLSSEEQDLKATGDSIRMDLSHLAGVEADKRALDPKDPAVDRLSEVAVDLADRIARKTRAERELSTDID
jgi:hypothetical protein